ncbi:MAG: DUF790 family protein [Polyangiaceae bacterium]|nr:DUF790 family protein [Polyangiaceae bacterium]
MLTSDLLAARKREGVLRAQYLQGDSRQRLLPVARDYLDCYKKMVGRPREEVDLAARSVQVSARDRVAALGLRKVLDDQCEFETALSSEPEEVRREVFLLAAQAHRQLDVRDTFDRESVLRSVGEKIGKTAPEIDALLFADLRGAERLQKVWSLGPEALIDRYNVALAQSLILKATRISLLVTDASPDRYRRLFRAMRFLGLLYQVTLHTEKAEEPAVKKGKKKRKSAAPPTEQPSNNSVYSILIDGPFSLFGPSVKYGLRLATLLHAILGCERFFLTADVLWGAKREPLTFRIGPEDGLVPVASELPTSSPLLDTFVSAFERIGSDWEVKACTQIFATPGEPAVIPDLVFCNRKTGEEVFLEAFGFWSREAVWRRVEQIRRGGVGAPLLLAVGKELRVSADVLDEEDQGEIYVYKSTMLPRAVLERLEKWGKRT